jgi:YVTN family beta-propeller protein
MKKRVFYMTCLTMVLLLAAPALAQSGAAKAPGYHLVKKIVIGNEGLWDYLALDTESRILYISHGTVVELFNIDTGVKGEPIPELQGVHGIAFAHKLGRGYISNGKANTVTVFDLKTRKKLAEVKTGANPDAILYDEFSDRVFTFNGRSADATVINRNSPSATPTVLFLSISRTPAKSWSLTARAFKCFAVGN